MKRSFSGGAASLGDLCPFRPLRLGSTGQPGAFRLLHGIIARPFEGWRNTRSAPGAVISGRESRSDSEGVPTLP